MDRIYNRLFAWLLAASMLLTLIPTPSHAIDTNKLTHQIQKEQPSSGIWINPLYADLDLELPQKEEKFNTCTIDITIDDVRFTLEDAAITLRDGMVARDEDVYVTFPANADFDATAIWDTALMHTGDPREGDYILGQLSYYSWNAYYSTISGVGYYTYVFSPGYFTTAAQEQEMDDAVDALLDQLDLWDASDYDKIKGIYDWLCQNVSYDYDNLNNSSYLLKHSAYAAMIHKTAVCQGYAVLFYRLALELGVDARYIAGVGNGGGHAWNIVKLDDLYYNLDATWDRSYFEAGLDYHYFLCGSGNFADHTRNEEYDTPEFHQSYPMSPEDYGVDLSWPVSGSCGDSMYWSLDANGVLTVSGSGNMYDYYSEDPGWYDYAWHIQKVVVGEDVETVGAYAFYYCFNLTDVTILGSTILAEAAFSYCESLVNVDMPKVTVLSDNAFYGCSALSKVNLPASLLQLGNQVFYGCIALQELTVDAGNLYYTAQNNVLFNKDMTHLYAAAAQLGEAYAIPETVVLISDYAFYGNPTLRFVTVPASVKALPEGVFHSCAALESVSLPATLETIGDFAFYFCEAMLQITLPQNLTHIGFYAFSCTGLNAVTIPGQVKTISDGAFMDCELLVAVTFKGAAPAIGDDAFGNVFADVYYPNPGCDTSWSGMQMDYGGYLVWNATDAHSYSAVVTAPTCEAQGYTTHTCGCGHSYTDNYVDALGHAWDDGVINIVPTEEQSGECTYTCLNCGTTRIETLPPQTHEHSYSAVVTAPTCDTQGFTTYTCRCGHSYTDDYVDALGHSYTSVVTAPTCTQQGYTTYTCSVCGDNYVGDYIAALGHSFTKYVADGNTTCTQDGTKTAICDHGCGEKHTVADPGSATGHSYTSVVTPPTCTAQGYTTHICHCGHSYVDSYVDATGHEMGQWQIITPATKEREGLKRRQCLHCDHTEEEIIPIVTGPSEITSDVYSIENDTVSRIVAGTTVADFLSGFHETEYVKVFKDGTEASADTKVGTGMELKLIVDGQVIQTLTVVVTGDINGDGTISVTDMISVKSHLLKKTTLDGVKALAADTSGDGAISITDFLQIKAQILNKSSIKPHGNKPFRIVPVCFL